MVFQMGPWNRQGIVRTQEIQMDIGKVPWGEQNALRHLHSDSEAIKLSKRKGLFKKMQGGKYLSNLETRKFFLHVAPKGTNSRESFDFVIKHLVWPRGRNHKLGRSLSCSLHPGTAVTVLTQLAPCMTHIGSSHCVLNYR